MTEQFTMATDGATLGKNPARMAIGVLIFDSSNKLIKYHHEKLQRGTNMQAEYTALNTGLSLAISMGIKNLRVLVDNQAMVLQLDGTYKVRTAHLKPLIQATKALGAGIPGGCPISWVNRETPHLVLADAASKGKKLEIGKSLEELLTTIVKENDYDRRGQKACTRRTRAGH